MFAPYSAPISLGTPNFNFSNPSSSYQSAYQNYTNTNQQLYNNFMGMLNQTMGGYGQLMNQVQARLAGSNKANIQDINDKYAAMSGQMAQQMVDRGLGNTTVQQSVQRGVAQDQAKETTRSRGEFAQLMANAMSNIGLTGLGSGMQGLGMMMQGISAPPPDAGMWAQLAQMQAQGKMPGMLPGMPGPSPGYSPTGGAIPTSLFAPSSGADIGGYGGGGGYGLADLSYASAARLPSSNPYGGVVSGAGIGYNGQYSPSYATSPQDVFMPSGGYGAVAEATGYPGAYAE